MDRGGADHLSRRRVLAALAAAGAATTPLMACPAGATDTDREASALFAALDRKILVGMRDFAIPGAAVGVIWRGRTHLRGYGVTSLDDPEPVDADTLFRIASNSKTFTGTAAMRLVDDGRLDLDQRVDRYVRDFVAPPGTHAVTVRQTLNHTGGWLGYDYHDTGADDGALARYVRRVRDLPQLTPVGRTFSYSNSCISVAGRVIETVTGRSYEDAVQELVLEPLGLTRSFFSRDLPDRRNLALPHDAVDGKAVVDRDLFYLPRSCNPFGGVVSSVRDLLAYARFHLGDGRAASGRRVMGRRALRAMWRHPGPGGTLLVELTGMGVSWSVRPTAQGTPVVQHGGDLPGYHSGLMLVPDQDFAIALLTNANSGPQLVAQLFFDDWALRRFCGLSNLPAAPRRLTRAQLATYEGSYTAQQIPFTGPPITLPVELVGEDGALTMIEGSGSEAVRQTLTFYRRDHVILPIGARADFLRDRSGQVIWLRFGGRLFRRLR